MNFFCNGSKWMLKTSLQNHFKHFYESDAIAPYIAVEAAQAVSGIQPLPGLVTISTRNLVFMLKSTTAPATYR